MTFLIGGAIGIILAVAAGRLASLGQNWRVWALGIAGLFGYHFVISRRSARHRRSRSACSPISGRCSSSSSRHCCRAKSVRAASSCRRCAGASGRTAGDQQGQGDVLSGRAAFRPSARLCLRHHLGRLFGVVAALCRRSDRHRRRVLPGDRTGFGRLPSAFETTVWPQSAEQNGWPSSHWASCRWVPPSTAGTTASSTATSWCWALFLFVTARFDGDPGCDGFAPAHWSVAAACLLITAGAVITAKDMLGRLSSCRRERKGTHRAANGEDRST